MMTRRTEKKTQKILSRQQLSFSHEVSLGEEELFRQQCDQCVDGRKTCNL